jgi:hypothetical protein
VLVDIRHTAGGSRGAHYTFLWEHCGGKRLLCNTLQARRALLASTLSFSAMKLAFIAGGRGTQKAGAGARAGGEGLEPARRRGAGRGRGAGGLVGGGAVRHRAAGSAIRGRAH